MKEKATEQVFTENPLLVSIEECALSLGVRPSTIRAWILQKRIGSCKIGARRLVPQDEVIRLIRENYQPATKSLV